MYLSGWLFWEWNSLSRLKLLHYIKHEGQTVFITFQENKKRVGNTVMRSSVFLTKSTVLGIVMKLCFACLIDPLDQN